MVALGKDLISKYFGGADTKIGGMSPAFHTERVAGAPSSISRPNGVAEGYANGQGINGLNGGFLSRGTGEDGAHKLNVYY